MPYNWFDSEEMERHRLARRLHDGPLQLVHSADFELVAILRQAEESEGLAGLKEVRNTLRHVTRELRMICQDLRPPALTPFGICAVIRSYAEALLEDQPDLRIELDLESDEQRLSERTRILICRVCQQTLPNVIAHAQAEHLYIGLRLSGDNVELRIEDDGCGFDLPDDWFALARQNKWGLLTTVQRVEAIGGSLLMHTAPGRGVQILVVAPAAA
jgi:signal transduction histidine kinase